MHVQLTGGQPGVACVLQPGQQRLRHHVLLHGTEPGQRRQPDGAEQPGQLLVGGKQQRGQMLLAPDQAPPARDGPGPDGLGPDGPAPEGPAPDGPAPEDLAPGDPWPRGPGPDDPAAGQGQRVPGPAQGAGGPGDRDGRAEGPGPPAQAALDGLGPAGAVGVRHQQARVLPGHVGQDVRRQRGQRAEMLLAPVFQGHHRDPARQGPPGRTGKIRDRLP